MHTRRHAMSRQAISMYTLMLAILAHAPSWYALSAKLHGAGSRPPATTSRIPPPLWHKLVTPAAGVLHLGPILKGKLKGAGTRPPWQSRVEDARPCGVGWWRRRPCRNWPLALWHKLVAPAAGVAQAGPPCFKGNVLGYCAMPLPRPPAQQEATHCHCSCDFCHFVLHAIIQAH